MKARLWSGFVLVLLALLISQVASAQPTIVATVLVQTNPAGVAVNSATNRIYVTNLGADSVSVIDGVSLNVVTTIAVGSSPQGIGLNSTTNRLYVSNFGSGTVSVIDTTTNSVIATISGLKVNPNDGPAEIAVNPITNRIYVGRTAHAGGIINVIDGATNAVSTISVGSHPATLAVNAATNRVYVANFFSDSISVVDGATASTIATIGGISSPIGVSVNPITNRIYVGSSSGGTITVVDGATNTILATIPVDPDPFRNAANATTNRIYVTHRYNNTVSVIDGSTHTVTSISGFSTSVGVDVDSATNRAYVTNFDSNSVAVLADTSTPTATTTAVCAAGDFVEASSSPISVGVGPVFVVTGDFNGDGRPDLAVSNSGSSSVSVLLGDGAGNFSPAATSPEPAGSNPWAIAVGDFNQDGNADLAVANLNANTLTILLGSGTGDFSPAPTSPEIVQGAPRSVAAGDFNLDGKLDVAVAKNSSGHVDILLGDGTGNFNPAPVSSDTYHSGPGSVAVGDFNLDGKLDLAVGDYNANTVSIVLGDGTGQFTAAPTSPEAVGAQPYSVTVADFNLDGRPDLGVVNISSLNVTILLGNGTGDFSPGPTSPQTVGGAPTYMGVGDFNLDGRPDLAVANSNSNNVTILLGDGSGAFTEAATSPEAVGASPLTVAVGDFDQNGAPDLAVANFSSHSVSVLLNACAPSVTPTPTASPTETPTPTPTPTETPTPTPTPVNYCAPGSSAITSNFNGTSISGGRYIWFNSVAKVTGVGSSKVTLRFENAQITSGHPALNASSMPRAQITFDPAVSSATTTFNTATNTWETVVPSSYTNNVFLNGFTFPVPSGGLPGGINPVAWQGTFHSDTPGVSVQWKWAAAVYTSFSTDYNAIGVKPVEGSKLSFYANSDHAGTPEQFRAYVTGGARGGGGSNYTGSYSGTEQACR